MVNTRRQAGCRIATEHRMTSVAVAIDIGIVITHQEMCLLGSDVKDTFKFSIEETTSMAEVASNESVV